MLHRFRLTAVLLVILSCLLPIRAQSQNPVVYGVMFYSQNCGHCRELIENHWPQIQTEFGDQLRVLFVNIDDKQGIQFKRDTEAALGIESYGVPMLIIGSEVMIGTHISNRAPAVIRAGLEAGGIDFLPIPGIHQLYRNAVKLYEEAQSARDSYGPTAVFSPVAVIDNSLAGRLAADPIANAVAILVLILLLLSLLAFTIAGWHYDMSSDPRLLRALSGRINHSMLLLLSLIGLALSLSLLAGWNDQWFILLLAGGEFAVFLVSFMFTYHSLPMKPLSTWFVPLLSLAGLAATAYLTSVEMTATEAVCGVVGNCNVIQQSSYARIFDIPIAVWGMVGYVGIILIWVWVRSQRVWARRVLMVLVTLGTGFSAYLTFLEPFVIGASCGWCLTSAVLMLMLLWIVVLSQIPSPNAHLIIDRQRVGH
jgi:uncharacterized membrane protein/thiol-disulfide isomerase/thioredoxin